jgi:putative ABC transport system permease protein
MFRSYFITSVRNLLRHKGYSILKIIGLSLGLAASLIIYLYVTEDRSYDKLHKNYDRIARLLTIDSGEGVSSKVVGVTAPALGPAAEAELPEVLKAVRISGGGSLDLSYGDKLLKCDAGFRVESSFFEIFDFKILDGKTTGALDDPNTIAITEKLSKRIFGDESPIGKTIRLNQNTELHVTALVQDPPRNSHLQFDLLRSMTPAQGEDGLRNYLQSWDGLGMFTYVLLDEPLDTASLNPKLKALGNKNLVAPFFTSVAQPLSDVHLNSTDILFERNANKSDMLNVYVLSVIAVLIILLATVNFVNMVTAKAAGRAKEVGLRKVIGAVRSQLIIQHLTESIIVTFASAAIALLLVIAATPVLNGLYQRWADFTILFEPLNLLLIITFVFGVGIIAGLYPAFVLSSFKPVSVLKGSFKNSAGGIHLRKALVIIQFTISIALMVSTAIVYQQMNFIYTADLGYQRDQVITIAQSGRAVGNSETFRNELLRNPNIVAAGTSSTRIGQQLSRNQVLPEGYPTESNIISSAMSIDADFIPALGMQIKNGRNFSLEFADSASVIVNEEMVRFLKWDHESAIGKKMGQLSGPGPNDYTYFTIVGVVKDFHFATIKHKLEPLVLFYNNNNPALSIKVKAENMDETIAFIENTWKTVNAGATFEYAFLDEQFANLYTNEKAFAGMFTHFTVLAMIIAGLGLFALSAFTAEQRRKEIGIRKVLGASNGNILYNLSAEFMILISISFVLASCASWFMMDRWLGEFQYHITMSAWTFIAAGVASLAIALATISFQALKAAFTNPIESLRID